MRDPGRVMQSHIDMQKETSIGIISKMRQCGHCKKRRSLPQFARSPVYCLQCVNRVPQVVS